MKKIAIAFAVLLLAACNQASGPYLAITGGSFIFNYRIAEVLAGVQVVANRDLPDGATIEVSFTDPAGGPPLVQSEATAPKKVQYAFTFRNLTGVRAKVDYPVTARLIGADGKEIEKIDKIYRSDVDQEIMPAKPLTVGPGYTPNTQ